MNELLTVAALILNAVSVAATHCLLGEDHTHWSQKRWRIKFSWWMPYRWCLDDNGLPNKSGGDYIVVLPKGIDWFHAFSALRWPLLVIVVYQMPWIWWIVVPVALQATWWITKKSFRKEWKSIKNPF